MTTTTNLPVKRRRKPLIVLLIALGLGGALIVAGMLTGVVGNPFKHGARTEVHAKTVEQSQQIMAVRPRKESSLPITVEQIAIVEPYFRADLRARASGIVRKVHRDIGDRVAMGDVLVEIDVPESEQDALKNEAVIEQRKQELKVSEAKLKDAIAARNVSLATIKQRLADVQGARATRDLKKSRFERFKDLATRGSVVGSVVDEEERDFLASEAMLASSEANVERARADFAESESRVEAAEADIDLKKAQIVVARRDADRARVVAEYGKILAPFDGVVVRRTADPGSFVQNATTGASESLISVAKVDLVTVAAKFPDNVAPLVGANTPAEVRVDNIPGVTIAARVTRFAPTVHNSDRTMRVEVDLFNGSEKEFERLLQDMKSPGPDRPMKGPNDPIPVRAFTNPSDPRRLVTGMTGTMKLTVGGFGQSFVLPSTAVFSRSGTNYIMVVEDDKTRQLPVKVQLTDGKTVRIALMTYRKDADGTTRDMLTELTGNEVVLISRQLEIGEGASVRTGLSDW